MNSFFFSLKKKKIHVWPFFNTVNKYNYDIVVKFTIMISFDIGSMSMFSGNFGGTENAMVNMKNGRGRVSF